MNKIGLLYESRAVEMLAANGLTILERNYTRKTGEIDIVALEGSCLVFVEVRVRRYHGYAGAAESINRAKQQRIIQTAQLYLQKAQLTTSGGCRFDVVAFDTQQSDNQFTANWIRSAFTA